MDLAAEMARLPEPKTDLAPPHWEYWRWDLWKRAQEGKPENFTQWPCVFHTMLTDHWKSIVETAELPHVKDVLGSLMFNHFGPSDILNRVHQAYHILSWQEVTGKRIADMQSIYEFGGGYGAMALVCRRLGFTGQYFIYDLPEFRLLQKWYLEEHGIDEVYTSDGNHAQSVDLLIACYSLSEMPLKERDALLKKVKSDNYLFLYSAKWEEYDNLEYFRGLYFGKQWQHEHIAHLPPESWYTWGY